MKQYFYCLLAHLLRQWAGWSALFLVTTALPAPAAGPADEQFARQFLHRLVLDDFDLRISHLGLRPGYAAVVGLAKTNQPLAALAAYEQYFFDKLRHPESYGISTHDVNPYVRGIAEPAQWPSYAFDPNAKPAEVIAVADKLLHGQITSGGNPVTIGDPGQVDWTIPDKNGKPQSGLISGGVFTPLAHAYVLTGREVYLRQWAAYMDDWAQHCNYYDTIQPCFAPDEVSGFGLPAAITCTRLLGGIATVMPVDSQALPPVTLARVIDRLLVQSLLSIEYIRSNTHNWTPGAGGLLLALIYDEFKVAPFYFRECRRRNVEDNAVTQNLRDGTENQQCPWYNENYLGVAAALQLFSLRRTLPPYKDVPWVNAVSGDLDWQREVQDHLNEHINYFIHLRTPQNERPLGYRGGDKRSAFGVPAGALFDVAPEEYYATENNNIVAAITRPGAGLRPASTADWFPYGGYAIVREGWEHDSGYGSMFCSSHPGAYGGYRSRSNNNSFHVAESGQDLLVSDEVGHYMYPLSPVKVDGLDQFFHAGIYKVQQPAAHKVYQICAWTNPAPWRWLASDRFNVMEGIYAGPYADITGRASQAFQYGRDESMQGELTLDHTVRGITHQRLVQFVRGARLWIVTDRLRAEKSHEYSQVWRLPITPAKFPVFAPAEIHVDQSSQSIVTASAVTNKANISLYQFASNPLQYHERTVKLDESNHYQMYGWQEITAAWKATGDSLVVTLVVPRAPGVGDVKNLKVAQSDGVCGFAVDAADGTHIQSLVAVTGTRILKLGRIVMTGESLLIAGPGGIALGCQSLSVDGKPVELPGPDFEFAIDQESKIVVRQPVYRPIEPVDIQPDRNVFTDSIDVVMTSPTPGVEIRYTLDQSDPTPHAALYTGPLKLTGSAVIKARAYRPGVTTNPPDTSSTHATPVSLAKFTKSTLVAPVKVAKTEPGLQSRYFEGDWKRLWLYLDELQPLRTGTATNLFAGAALQDKYYAYEYTGFLQIPADGVYTLHAPRELVTPDTDAGYELKVYLGNEEAPYAMRTQVVGLQEWYPSTRLHAYGNWSVALRAGLQPFKVVFVDYRNGAAAKLNKPGLTKYIWDGTIPDLEISGPSLAKQAIPVAWLRRAPDLNQTTGK